MTERNLDGNNRLSAEEMIDKCKVGRGAETCRYLGNAETNPRCLKHTALAGRINDRVASGLIVAKGDNCDGKKP